MSIDYTRASDPVTTVVAGLEPIVTDLATLTPTDMAEVKPGIRTTEFWLTVGAAGYTAFELAYNHNESFTRQLPYLGPAVLVAIYAAGRTFLKSRGGSTTPVTAVVPPPVAATPPPNNPDPATTQGTVADPSAAPA